MAALDPCVLQKECRQAQLKPYLTVLVFLREVIGNHYPVTLLAKSWQSDFILCVFGKDLSKGSNLVLLVFQEGI